MFTFVSGRASLDFVGTLKWRRDDREDQLVAPSALRSWVDASELRIRLLGTVDELALRRVVAVRESLYGAFTAALDGRVMSPVDVTRLNTVAAGAGPDIELDARGEVRRSGTVDQVLSELVRDAFEVLGSADRAQLRECGSPRCTRLFVDTSRARNRRWCGMTECGNRAKVAAFRARVRADETNPQRSPLPRAMEEPTRIEHS